jgi:hypothetical protein
MRQGHIYAHGFTPAASPAALKAMSRTIRRWALHHRSDKSLQDLLAVVDAPADGISAASSLNTEVSALPYWQLSTIMLLNEDF